MRRGTALDLSLEGKDYKIVLMPSRKSYLRKAKEYVLNGKKMSGAGSRANYVPLRVRQQGHFSGVIHFNAQDINIEIITHECFHLCFHHVGRYAAIKKDRDKEERLAIILGELVLQVSKWIDEVCGLGKPNIK